MGKNKGKKSDDGPKLSTPQAEAARIVGTAKSYGETPVYSATVNLGDDKGNLATCLQLVYDGLKGIGKSILLVSASDKIVISGAFSQNDKINPNTWVTSGMNMIAKKEGGLDEGFDENSEESDLHYYIQRNEVGGEAFAFKEKEVALSCSNTYIKKTGIMPEEEDSDDEMQFNLNDF